MTVKKSAFPADWSDETSQNLGKPVAIVGAEACRQARQKLTAEEQELIAVR
jgi:hypothetical protein